jgi:hypothetical protein
MASARSSQEKATQPARMEREKPLTGSEINEMDGP